MTDIQDKVIRNIERTWAGGEHMLAGQRASELVFGSGNKLNEKLYDKVLARVPGIERYVMPPAQPPIEQVSDESGYPLSRQPENQPQAADAPNASGEGGKAEQKVIDDALAPGRNARKELGSIGNTALNPPGSELNATDAAKAKRTSTK